jgi:hypothetical protein
MADTYITERDRYDLPTVSSGQFTEDINTRAAANLGTMSGQLNLLQMQKLQSEVNSADMARRQTIFQEDQRFKKQAETDDYVGFLMTQADQPEEDRVKNNNQYIKENPNLLRNPDAMQMFGNVDIGSRAQSEYNKRRVESKQTAYAENKIDFDIANQDKAEETALLQMDNTFKAATAQREAFDSALNSGKINNAGEVARLLYSSSLDNETKKNFSDVMSDLRLMGNETYTPALINMASALSIGSNLDKTYDYKMSRNAPLLNSLAKEGITLNWKGTDEEFEASIDEAEKNIASKFKPEEVEARLSGLQKAAKDITEYRGASTSSEANRVQANEKLNLLKELTKKSNLGDPEAKIEVERLLSELSVVAGGMKGAYDKNMADVERLMKIDKDNLDVRTKEMNIRKKGVDILNSREEGERQKLELEMKMETQDATSRATYLKFLQDQLETANKETKPRIQYQLDQLAQETKSTDFVAPAESSGSMIPR